VKNSGKKQNAVRMLGHAVRISMPTDEVGMSDMANGRLASVLRKDVHKLKRLARDGPDDLFWETLHKAVFRLVKYVHRTRC
jgi:hypothetical protein